MDSFPDHVDGTDFSDPIKMMRLHFYEKMSKGFPAIVVVDYVGNKAANHVIQEIMDRKYSIYRYDSFSIPMRHCVRISITPTGQAPTYEYNQED
jgi:hypothetical protein